MKTVHPNKMFEAMASARPLVLGVDGAARSLVEEAGAGVCAPPEDPDALARAIRSLAADRAAGDEMGRRGRAFVEQRFDRTVLARRLFEVLESVARP